jgi:hypothetical protein
LIVDDAVFVAVTKKYLLEDLADCGNCGVVVVSRVRINMVLAM